MVGQAGCELSPSNLAGPLLGDSWSHVFGSFLLSSWSFPWSRFSSVLPGGCRSGCPHSGGHILQQVDVSVALPCHHGSPPSVLPGVGYSWNPSFILFGESSSLHREVKEGILKNVSAYMEVQPIPRPTAPHSPSLLGDLMPPFPEFLGLPCYYLAFSQLFLQLA